MEGLSEPLLVAQHHFLTIRRFTVYFTVTSNFTLAFLDIRHPPLFVAFCIEGSADLLLALLAVNLHLSGGAKAHNVEHCIRKICRCQIEARAIRHAPFYTLSCRTESG